MQTMTNLNTALESAKDAGRVFSCLEDMKRAYATEAWGQPDLWRGVPAHYVPSLYRGGWFVAGFGVSTERGMA
jgi:hypothetical protein